MGFTLIKKQTISSGVSSVEFIDGSSDVVFDSTYKTYVFQFENMVSDSGEQNMLYQATTDGGTTWNSVSGNWVRTMPFIYDDSGAYNSNLATTTEADRNITSGWQLMSFPAVTVTGGSFSGSLYFYDPANSSQYKVALMIAAGVADGNGGAHWLTYGRLQPYTLMTTSAINGLKFFVSSGTIDGGDISLFGINTG